jgi:hypothetical protein
MFSGIYQGSNADWGVTYYFTNIVLKVLAPPLARPGALHLNRVLKRALISAPRSAPPGNHRWPPNPTTPPDCGYYAAGAMCMAAPEKWLPGGCIWLHPPGHNNIVPGGTGGGSIFFNLRGRGGVGVGVKQGPKTPHLGGQLRLAPRRAAGRCRGGGRATPCFRCTPLYPGTRKWGP